LKLATVPFLNKPSTLKADDPLSKADSVPWIGTHVIITQFGNPLKGYVGVVKDVLRGQDTASGLKVIIQLVHLNPSSPFKTTVVDYDDVVEQRSFNESSLISVNTNMPTSTSSRTGSSLLDYAEPRSALFQPSKAYMKSARRTFGPPPQAPMPVEPTSGGATPMPDQISSLTPAWDPSSRTPPRYSRFYHGLLKLTAY
jgi:hypothetical protein